MTEKQIFKENVEALLLRRMEVAHKTPGSDKHAVFVELKKVLDEIRKL